MVDETHQFVPEHDEDERDRDEEDGGDADGDRGELGAGRARRAPRRASRPRAMARIAFSAPSRLKNAMTLTAMAAVASPARRPSSNAWASGSSAADGSGGIPWLWP